MAKDILARMKERAPSFTKGQRAIAGYILDTFEKAAFLTAGRLGRAVGVSESTVVRFAMELGYDGYPSMQKELQELVLKRLTAVQRMEVAQDRLKNQDVVDAVLEADMEKIRKTQEKLDRKDFQAAVHGMLRARKLYILGSGFYPVLPIGQVDCEGLGGGFEAFAAVHGDDKGHGARFARLQDLVFTQFRHVHMIDLVQLVHIQPIVPQVGIGRTLIGHRDGVLNPSAGQREGRRPIGGAGLVIADGSGIDGVSFALLYLLLCRLVGHLQVLVVGLDLNGREPPHSLKMAYPTTFPAEAPSSVF